MSTRLSCHLAEPSLAFEPNPVRINLQISPVSRIWRQGCLISRVILRHGESDRHSRYRLKSSMLIVFRPGAT